MAECPVCKTAIAENGIRPYGGTMFPGVCVQCPRCGDFTLIGTALEILAREGDKERHRKAITSHAIRRMQRHGGEAPTIFDDQLRAIWQEDRLPTPQRQCLPSCYS
jgi:hypothetical protein